MSKQLRISLAIALLVIGLLFYYRYTLVFNWQQYLINSISKKGVVNNGAFVDSSTTHPYHSIYALKGTERLLPHRVNSLQRLQYLYPYFKGFECDTRFNLQTQQLHIGHDESDVNELLFADYLQVDSAKKMFWLDVKNLDSNNVQQFISTLDALDKLYQLKQRIIVESTQLKVLNAVAAKGYLCSYYVLVYDKKQLYANSEDIASFNGLVSQEYALLPQMMAAFPKHQKITWEINFLASHNKNQLQSFINNKNILCCLINVKSPYYR